MDSIDPFAPTLPTPTANRPLLGLTVLVIEDSRFACEAMRLLCLRSGARIRRADSVRSARRHLKVYRPTIAIIDIGLPDGSGIDLIADLTSTSPRPEVVIGTSGDDFEADVLAAGADGYLAKPLTSLSVFQECILSCLPSDRRPNGLRALSDENVEPDPLAYQDDIAHVLTSWKKTKTNVCWITSRNSPTVWRAVLRIARLPKQHRRWPIVVPKAKRPHQKLQSWQG